jgi:hypothetical protein
MSSNSILDFRFWIVEALPKLSFAQPYVALFFHAWYNYKILNPDENNQQFVFKCKKQKSLQFLVILRK